MRLIGAVWIVAGVVLHSTATVNGGYHGDTDDLWVREETNVRDWYGFIVHPSERSQVCLGTLIHPEAFVTSVQCQEQFAIGATVEFLDERSSSSTIRHHSSLDDVLLVFLQTECLPVAPLAVWRDVGQNNNGAMQGISISLDRLEATLVNLPNATIDHSSFVVAHGWDDDAPIIGGPLLNDVTGVVGVLTSRSLHDTETISYTRLDSHVAAMEETLCTESHIPLPHCVHSGATTHRSLVVQRWRFVARLRQWLRNRRPRPPSTVPTAPIAPTAVPLNRPVAVAPQSAPIPVTTPVSPPTLPPVVPHSDPVVPWPAPTTPRNPVSPPLSTVVLPATQPRVAPVHPPMAFPAPVPPRLPDPRPAPTRAPQRPPPIAPVAPFQKAPTQLPPPTQGAMAPRRAPLPQTPHPAPPRAPKPPVHPAPVNRPWSPPRPVRVPTKVPIAPRPWPDTPVKAPVDGPSKKPARLPTRVPTRPPTELPVQTPPLVTLRPTLRPTPLAPSMEPTSFTIPPTQSWRTTRAPNALTSGPNRSKEPTLVQPTRQPTRRPVSHTSPPTRRPVSKAPALTQAPNRIVDPTWAPIVQPTLHPVPHTSPPTRRPVSKAPTMTNAPTRPIQTKGPTTIRLSCPPSFTCPDRNLMHRNCKVQCVLESQVLRKRKAGYRCGSCV